MDEEIHAAELCPCGYGRSAGVERDNLVCLQRKRLARAGIRAVAGLPGHAPGRFRAGWCRPAPRRTGRRRLNRSRSFFLGVAPLPSPLHAAEGTLFIELRKGTFLKRFDTSLFICCFTVRTELFCAERSSLTSWQEVQCHGPQHRVPHSFPWTNRRPSLFRVGSPA